MNTKVTQTIYDFKVKNIFNKQISLSIYKNKVILIVNTASKCGFTPQYKELEELYQKYKNNDFVILGFPSNQFLYQEPASNEDISKFCSLNYNITFPMFSKIEVNGNNTEPLYKYLKSQAKGIFKSNFIKWNFTKFLIDKNGYVFKRYAPFTSPKDIEQDIQKLL